MLSFPGRRRDLGITKSATFSASFLAMKFALGWTIGASGVFMTGIEMLDSAHGIHAVSLSSYFSCNSCFNSKDSRILRSSISLVKGLGRRIKSESLSPE